MADYGNELYTEQEYIVMAEKVIFLPKVLYYIVLSPFLQ